MSVAYDLYVPARSWLHEMDPRVKLLLSLDLTLLLFLWPRPIVILATLGALHWLLWRAGVPWSRLRWVWWVMLPLHIMVPGAWFLFQPVGPTFFEWGLLRLSWGGLVHGIWVVLRLDALAFAAFLWLFTTPPHRMWRAFVGLGLPYPLALMLALALRYLPTVAGLYVQVVDAQQARGLVLDKGPLWRRLRDRLPVLVAVIIGTLRLAQALGWALEARALGATLPPGRRRTQWRPLRLRRVDRAYLVGFVLLGMMIVAARVWRVG